MHLSLVTSTLGKLHINCIVISIQTTTQYVHLSVHFKGLLSIQRMRTYKYTLLTFSTIVFYYVRNTKQMNIYKFVTSQLEHIAASTLQIVSCLYRFLNANPLKQLNVRRTQIRTGWSTVFYNSCILKSYRIFRMPQIHSVLTRNPAMQPRECNSK